MLSRWFGEQLVAAAVARADLTAVSVRPAWVQWRATSSAMAEKLFGWVPECSRRDWLDPEGRLLPEARDRLAAGETAVQRGLRAIG